MRNQTITPKLLIVTIFILGCNLLTPDTETPEQEIPSPTLQSLAADLTPLAAPSSGQPVTSKGTSNIAQVWANEGGDKVTRDELRATNNLDSVRNSAWNGSEISLFGAHNETVSFNLVLEAPTADAGNINVTLTELSGPNGAAIITRPANGDELFNYVGRNIELFYIRYLEIRGLSTDLFYHGFDYDERHIPARCRRPYDADGEGSGSWDDRPCHNLFYPDIAVPLELESPFTISEGSNQSIWGDIYIPKDVPAGEYTGTIAITENGAPTWQIPLRLQVRNFTLPDLPSARTVLFYSLENIGDRYLNQTELESDTAVYAQAQAIADRHFQLAHRHKVSLIDTYTPLDQMEAVWLDRLNGRLFTPERGFDGPGIGVGNNVYSIGTYQSWPWAEGGEAAMWANTDAWVTWFEDQSFTTPTDYFLYLIDEPEFSDELPQAEEWLAWMDSNPGPGNELLSLITISLPVAAEETPSLAIPAFWAQFGIFDEWESLAGDIRNDPNRRLYAYNSNRPATGSFGIEDEGIALRTLSWAQYKKGIDRWFYWESTYYNNFQGGTGQTNVFQQAHTFGGFDETSDVLGETGWNYLNGDGVLFYPGTDLVYPEASYSVKGPLASLRLKHWRRGIQDMDYLSMAAQIDPERTAEIIQALIPKVLWEVGVTELEDPTYVLTDISWPTSPDLWEAARAELADIIEAE